MIYNVDELSDGQTVFLYPHTKTASQACHRQLQVKVLGDPKRHWPLVTVKWREGEEERWQLVHKDDIKKNKSNSATETSAADRHQGDTVGAGPAPARPWQRRLTIGKPVENFEGQGKLF